ncbi:MarR family winged helix-turn-helix transcriptional regulator [Methanobrevibacter arboriphilus]|nr:MarR family transcriptional regulator [Methanobrevibacter arboriphilus]
MQQTYRNKDINPYKGQGRVLALLKMQPEIMQKELGYLLDISTQALAELLNKLEKKGYIIREQSKKDRRSFVIKLTDAGREATPEENDEMDYNYVEELFDCLTEEEQDNLLNYIEIIIKNIENELDEDDYITFFRKRFFEKHENQHHNLFRGFWGFHNKDSSHHNHHKFKGFGGKRHDR